MFFRVLVVVWYSLRSHSGRVSQFHEIFKNHEKSWFSMIFIISLLIRYEGIRCVIWPKTHEKTWKFRCPSLNRVRNHPETPQNIPNHPGDHRNGPRVLKREILKKLSIFKKMTLGVSDLHSGTHVLNFRCTYFALVVITGWIIGSGVYTCICT